MPGAGHSGAAPNALGAPLFQSPSAAPSQELDAAREQDLAGRETLSAASHWLALCEIETLGVGQLGASSSFLLLKKPSLSALRIGLAVVSKSGQNGIFLDSCFHHCGDLWSAPEGEK